jgi:hypothetical protein
MKKSNPLRKIFLLALTAIIICSYKEETKWTCLLDKNLSHWDNYLSFRHQIGYNGQAPKDKDGKLIPPIGLNKTGYNVFTVKEEGNEPVLKISGEIYGCLITKEEYSNYHLSLKVRWGDKKWDPRKKLLKDSGILYHSVGQPGAEYWRTWMQSQEFQIMEGHMGDYWSQANSAIDIKAFIPEGMMNSVADENQPFVPFGKDGESGFCLRSANYENGPGEWNTVELICFNGNSLHLVNGHVVMILRNSRSVVDGKTLPMIKGKIQLQSEAAEVYYKDIKIQTLESFPTEYAKYFQ